MYCKACDKYLALLCEKNHSVHNEQVSEQDDEQDLMAIIVKFCSVRKFSNEQFNFPNRSYFKSHFPDEMLQEGMLKMTIPDRPSSKKRKCFFDRFSFGFIWFELNRMR